MLICSMCYMHECTGLWLHQSFQKGVAKCAQIWSVHHILCVILTYCYTSHRTYFKKHVLLLFYLPTARYTTQSPWHAGGEPRDLLMPRFQESKADNCWLNSMPYGAPFISDLNKDASWPAFIFVFMSACLSIWNAWCQLTLLLFRFLSLSVWCCL